MPAILSLSSHLLLLAIVAFILYRIPQTGGSPVDRTGEIVLAFVDENQKKSFFTKSESDQVNEKSPPQTSITDTPPPAIKMPEIALDELTGPTPIKFDNASEFTSDTTGSGRETPYELSEDDLKLIVSEQKLVENRRPKGSETTISVFGSGKLTGRRFVFLIDRSKSMGDQGLGVLRKARSELGYAINQLEDHHLFQIVVYHNSTGTIGRRELLPATQENKQRVPEFLQSLMAFGGTNHERGLYSALAFNPDVMVMMTDGGSPDLHDGQIETVKQIAGNTQIHTIQFGLGSAKESNHFLQRLSLRTSGTYRYVDVRQWRK